MCFPQKQQTGANDYSYLYTTSTGLLLWTIKRVINNLRRTAIILIDYSFSDFFKNNIEISPLTCLMKTAITIQIRKYSP